MPDGPKILLDEISPSGNVKAVVEARDETIYFYLGGADDTDFGMRRCWVGNLTTAPDALDSAGLAEGLSVPMPEQACGHPSGREIPDANALSLLWFEEGDAAALLEEGELLAVIPGWSGMDGFAGYARDCTTPTPLAAPLGTVEEPFDEAVFERIGRAQQFWAWTESNPWPGLQANFLQHFENQLGPHTQYWTIDGGYWPPRGLVQFDPPSGSVGQEVPGVRVFLTVGMCLRAMPQVDFLTDEPEQMRRIELGFAVDRSLAEGCGESIIEYMCAHANLPWERITCLSEGHVLGASRLLKDTGLSGEFPNVLLRKGLKDAPRDPEWTILDDPVHLLWLTPITQAEYEWAEATSVDDLAEQMKAKAVPYAFSSRGCLTES